MLNLSIFTILRNDNDYISRWVKSILPFARDGSVQKVFAICSAEPNDDVTYLSTLCEVVWVNCPNKNISQEDPLKGLDYVREWWNRYFPIVDTEFVWCLDGDIIPPDNAVKEFEAYAEKYKIMSGVYNLRGAESLMLSYYENPMEIYPRDIPSTPFIVYYAGRACLFGRTGVIKAVSVPLKQIPDKPYYCTGFYISQQCYEQFIDIYIIPSVVCNHVD